MRGTDKSYIIGQNGHISCRVYKTQNLKIGFWNINGLYDDNNKLKLNDPIIQKEIQGLDIMAFLETHVGNENTVTLPGYQTFTCNRKISNNGRFYGGILLFIKHSLMHGIEILKNMTADYMWVKLDRVKLKILTDIYICVCYIPPESSPYLDSQNLDILDNIRRDSDTYGSRGYVLINGDLNGRTNTEPDFIRFDENQYTHSGDNYTCDSPICTRHSMDTKPLNTRGKQIIDMCISCHLRILNGRTLGDASGYMTCHKYNGSSVVDYMLASSQFIKNVRDFKVHSYYDSISDHCMVSANINISPEHKTPEEIKLLPAPDKLVFDNTTINAYQKLLTSNETRQKVQNIKHLKNNCNETLIETQLQQINDLLHETANRAGVIRRRMKSKKSKNIRKAKWHNHSFAQQKRDLCKLSNDMVNNPYDLEIRHRFFSKRKQVRRANKQLKRTYMNTLVEKLNDLRQDDPKSYWNLIGEMASINKKEKNNPAASISPSEWIEYYKKLNANNIPETVEQTLKDIIQEKEKNKSFSELDYRITEAEIVEAARLLKNGKASGTDSICNEMLKNSINNIISCLLPLMNNIFASSYYPRLWAEVYIINLHKSGPPSDPFNYRGISIGNALAKLFNTIMNKRLVKYLVKHKIISKTQIGFLEGSRTADHLFTLKTIIDKYVKKAKKTIYLCFVDLKKAFDTVWHTGLLHKLQNVGINGKFYQLVKNMYSKITYKIKCENGLTQPEQSGKGVRQGDVLSPQLFNLFIDDLNKELLEEGMDNLILNNRIIPCLLYADDMVLMSATKSGLQKQIDQLQSYCGHWNLEVNTTKTKILTVSNKTKIDSTVFTYKNTPLEQTDAYPYLGTIIDKKGSFKQNESHLYKKGVKALHKLWSSFKGMDLSVKNKLHLFDHTVKPVILYACEVTYNFNINSANGAAFEDLLCKAKVEQAHKKMLRYILGVSNRSSIDATYAEVGRFPLYMEIIKRMLLYESRLVTVNEDTLLYDAYYENKSMNNDGYNNCWIGLTKYIKQALGIDRELVLSKSNIDLVTNKLKERFIQSWHIRINSEYRGKSNVKNKLRTYKKFKSEYKYEQYLDTIKKTEDRQHLTKFRISLHRLQIEIGRHQRKDISERICKRCTCHKIEDEQHALLNCPGNKQARQELMDYIQRTNTNYNNLTEENQFIWIMINEDPDIIRLLSKFIGVLAQ